MVDSWRWTWPNRAEAPDILTALEADEARREDMTRREKIRISEKTA